jgi:PAS domain S-box-containing protein
VLAVGLGLLLRVPGWSVLGTSSPYLTFIPAVMLSAWYGGFGPGLLSTALSAIAALFFFVDPLGKIDATNPTDAAGLIGFCCSGVFVSWLTGRLQDARRAEQRLRLVSEQTLAGIGDAVMATDTEGRVTFMNTVAEQLTGWSFAEAKSQPIEAVFRIVNESTGDPIESPVTKALRDGTVQGLANHTELIDRHGRRVPIDDSGAPIRDRDGTPIGAVVVFRDISERRQAEHEIQTSRERLRSTLESITDAFVTLDQDWRFTYVNHAAERILGRSREELLGKNHWEEYPVARDTIVEQSYRRAIAEQRAVRFEYYYPPLAVWLEVNTFPTDAGGLAIYFRDVTGAKLTNQRLRESEARLQAVVDSLPLGIVLAELPTGRIVFGNPQIERIMRHPVLNTGGVERYNEWPLLDASGQLVPGEQYPIARALRTGESASGEYLYRRGDGTLTWIEVSGEPVRAPGGDVTGAVVAVADISERKQAEEARRKAEERLSFALEAGGNIGTWDWDVAGDRVYADTRFAQLFGVDRARAEAGVAISEFVDAIHPEDRARVGALIRQAIERGEDYAAEYRLPQQDGSVRWVYARGRCHRDATGAATRFPGVVSDVTERRQAEAAVRESEERLRYALDSAGMVAWEWDLATDLVTRSGPVQSLFGVAPEQLAPRLSALAALVHPEDRERVRLAFERAALDGSAYYSEFRIMHPDGTARWMSDQGRCHFNQEGRPYKLSGVLMDITERKEADERVAAQARELQRSNDELQAFAYTASHDLQEPIRTVVSFTQLLARRYSGELGKEADETISLILEAANRMSKLVASLLDYSRVGEESELRRAPVNLGKVLQDTFRTLNFAIEDSEAVITHDPLPTVLADEQQMEQLLQNLLSNAIKYRRPGQRPEVHLAVAVQDNSWLFTMRDNGLGFKPRYAERIFGVFKRVHGRQYSGTGIGLAICKKIVERHGGRIWAESAGDGEGAAFHFTLPSVNTRSGVGSDS